MSEEKSLDVRLGVRLSRLSSDVIRRTVLKIEGVSLSPVSTSYVGRDRTEGFGLDKTGNLDEDET